MTDQLEYLFADLRADTMCEVRPPGAVAARRTLRRRRTNRTVGAAAFLVVAGAGGVTATTMALSPRADQVEPADRAAALAGIDPDAPGSGRGVARSEVVGTEAMVAGTYTLAVACVGRGWVSVTLRSAQRQVGQARTHCSEGQQLSVVVTFDLTRGGPVTTEVHADDEAAGRAGYAYQLRAS